MHFSSEYGLAPPSGFGVVANFGEIQLTPGETYYIVCKDTNEKERNVGWSVGATDPYEKGEFYSSSNSGETWNKDSSKDFTFITFGKTGKKMIIIYGIPNKMSNNALSDDTIFIDSSIQEAMFGITWDDGDLDLRLEMPDGRIINSTVSEINHNISYISNPTYEMYHIHNPMVGEWSLLVDEIVPISNEYKVFITGNTNLSLNLFLDKEQFYRGDQIQVSAYFPTNIFSMTDVSAYVDVKTPDGFDSLSLFDDGLHDDGEENDGLFSNYYTNTFESGIYNFSAMASGLKNGEYIFRKSDIQSASMIFSFPKANASGPYIAAVDEPIQFNGGNSFDIDGYITSHDWDFGDGSSGSGEQPIHTYSEKGTYTVNLIVIDNDELTNSYSTTAVVGIPYVKILYPVYHDKITDNKTLKWYAYDSDDNENLLIQLFYTNNYNDNWVILAEDIENSGEYNLDVTNFSENIYFFKISAVDTDGNIGCAYSDQIYYSKSPSIPLKPSGPPSGKSGEEYVFSTSAIDPEGQNIYYLSNWGDNSEEIWIGPFMSGKEANINHTYDQDGDYEIKVKAMDIYGYESEWSDPLAISMPKNKAISTPFLKFLENHPYLFTLLRQIFGLQ